MALDAVTNSPKPCFGELGFESMLPPLGEGGIVIDTANNTILFSTNNVWSM